MLLLFIILGVGAIFLNVLFVLVMWSKSKVRYAYKHYLCNLAVSNLLTSLLCLNWDIRTHHWSLDTPSWVCVVQFYGVQMGLYSTLGTVIAMSVDKTIAVKKPNVYQQLCTVRNTRFTLAGVIAVAVALSLLPTGDFADNLSPVCTVVDLYPRRYGTAVVASTLLVYLVAQIVSLSVLVVNLYRLITNRTDDERRQNKELRAQTHRGLRIILCSSVLYSLTMVPMIAFFYWLACPWVPLAFILNHNLSLAASCLVIILTYIDPFIYFLCVFKFRMPRKVRPLTTETPTLRS